MALGDSMRTVASLMLVFSCLAAALFASPITGVAAAKPGLDGRERAIVRAINRQRAKHGLSVLRSSRRLARAADFHSWEMLDANYFAHESRDGGPFDQRVRRFARHRGRRDAGHARRLRPQGGPEGRPHVDALARAPRDPAVRELPARRARQAGRRSRR